MTTSKFGFQLNWNRVIVENINKFVQVDANSAKLAEQKQECDDKGTDYQWVSGNCKLTKEAIRRLKLECEKEDLIWHGTYCADRPVEYYPSLSFIIPGGG